MNAQTNSQKRVVLVTGGTKGIGKTIAQFYLREGCNVVVCGRQEPDVLPSNGEYIAEFIACDVRSAEAVQDLINQVVDRHGQLDVLVNNAGGAPHVDAATVSPRFHESVLRLNLFSTLHASQAANAVMQKQTQGGVIVCVGSISALRPSPGTAAYGAAKAAVLSLVSSLAVEWAPKVRVVAVSPGLVRTEQSHLHYGDAQGVDAVAQTIPLQRLAEPDDIAQACLFVSSPQAGYMSGTNLLLHGGGERPAFLSAANAQAD